MKLRTVVSHPHCFRPHPSPFVVAPSASRYGFPFKKKGARLSAGMMGMKHAWGSVLCALVCITLNALDADGVDVMPTPTNDGKPRPEGKPLVLDNKAVSERPDRPAFLARPPGAPVYYGFPLVEETRTESWCYGAITDFLHRDRPEGCTLGDGYVQAPDGSRAGLVWGVGNYEPKELLKPDNQRWGVYAVSFPRPIHTVEDLVYNFRHVLPWLREVYNRIHGSA